MMLFLNVGCSEEDKSRCPDEFEVYVGEQGLICGASCPSETAEAYRSEGVLACNTCADDGSLDCQGVCATVCSPGCEDDTGGCCPLRVCQ